MRRALTLLTLASSSLLAQTAAVPPPPADPLTAQVHESSVVLIGGTPYQSLVASVDGHLLLLTSTRMQRNGYLALGAYPVTVKSLKQKQPWLTQETLTLHLPGNGTEDFDVNGEREP